MSVLSVLSVLSDPLRRWATRAALPLAGVAVGTAVGLAVAALIRRVEGPAPRPLELAPEGNTVEFDKGGVRVAQEAPSAAPGADEASEPAWPVLAGMAVTAIRPPFEVERELDRELGREAAVPSSG